MDDKKEIHRKIVAQWEVTPKLWESCESRFLVEANITFVISGNLIQAVIRNTPLDWEDFVAKVNPMIYSWREAWIFSTSKPFELSQPKGEIDGNPVRNYKDYCKVTSDFAVSVRRSDGVIKSDDKSTTFNQSRRILDLLQDKDATTLRGALAYYNLSVRSSDQLAIAGNLYMAMEELWHHPSFGKPAELADALKPFNNKITRTHVQDRVKRRLNNDRHAFLRNGSRAEILSETELEQQKQWVRELILAYVEWLKANS